jgi:GTP-binding protein
MSIFQQARFFTTADALTQLPNLGAPEIAFAGRSNAGKSTAINTICSQKRLAFASKTPGRTQHLNFFSIGTHAEDEYVPAGFIVDLPGYGYAQVGHAAKAHWDALLSSYIASRSELRGLVLIMDARRPMTDLDSALVDWFAPRERPIHAILTKADKLNRSDSTAALRATKEALAVFGPSHSAQLFSSLKKTGVAEAQERILEILGLKDANPRAHKVVPFTKPGTLARE